MIPKKKLDLDFRKVFTLDAVKARFKKIGYAPARGNGYASAVMQQACLLGSFEHAMFGEEEGGHIAEARTSIPKVILRALEAGWEQWPDKVSEHTMGNFNRTGALKRLGRQVNKADLQQDIVDAYELGSALGRVLIKGEENGA